MQLSLKNLYIITLQEIKTITILQYLFLWHDRPDKLFWCRSLVKAGICSGRIHAYVVCKCLLQDGHNDPFWPLYVPIPSLGYKFYNAERQKKKKKKNLHGNCIA